MKRKSLHARKELLKLIDEAWGREPYSPEVEAILAENTNDLEANEAKELFRGKNWWEMDDAVLDAGFPNPFLIGALPLCYFMPALLCCAIRNENTLLADFVLVDKFLPPKQEEALQRFTRDNSYFSGRQRKAIVAFLEYMKLSALHRNDEIELRKAKRIDDALSRFWSM